MELFGLNSLTFKAGPLRKKSSTKVHLGNVTLFVGPNNSGKSLALQEIHQWATMSPDQPQPWAGGKVLSSIEANWPPGEVALRHFLLKRAAGPQSIDSGAVVINTYELNQGVGGVRFPAQPTSEGTASIPWRNGWQSSFEEFCRSKVMRHYVAYLDGRSRFGLSEPRSLPSYRQPPSNHLAAIMRDAELHRRVDAMVFDAFQLHFVVDNSLPPNLTVGLTPKAPPRGSHQSMTPAAISYRAGATPISEYSDGVKVYCGMVSAVQSLPHSVILIDEPEAFLHPTLVRRLGTNLARIVDDRDANLIASTHSADFLMGCVEEVPETAIARLTYERGLATARVLDGRAVRDLVTQPLLRSADALSALFARAAVICEGDSDRALYAEINRRLLSHGRPGAPDTVFLNAQNWQTIPDLARPLRNLGIPAVMIVDLDALLEEGEWGRFFDILGLEKRAVSFLHEKRRRCAELLRALDMERIGESRKRRAKISGTTELPLDARREVDQFLEELGAVGIFPVPVGELENWLPQLGCGNKKTWVTEVLKRLGVRGDSIYIAPQEGDVWGFVEKISAWIQNPDRLGIPA